MLDKSGNSKTLGGLDYTKPNESEILLVMTNT